MILAIKLERKVHTFKAVYNKPDTQIVILAFSGMNNKQNKGLKKDYIFNHNIPYLPGLRS